MFALPTHARRPLGALVLAGLAAAAFGGCKVSTEIGHPCVLVRKPTAEEADGGVRSVEVRYREIPSGMDVISFGAVTCEDLICVLDADTPRGALDAPAVGYCTQPCVEGVSACEVTDPEAPEGLGARMACRSLILDQATLDTLRREDPDLYERSFGDNSASQFCAGALRRTDGGT